MTALEIGLVIVCAIGLLCWLAVRWKLSLLVSEGDRLRDEIRDIDNLTAVTKSMRWWLRLEHAAFGAFLIPLGILLIILSRR